MIGPRDGGWVLAPSSGAGPTSRNRARAPAIGARALDPRTLAAGLCRGLFSSRRGAGVPSMMAGTPGGNAAAGKSSGGYDGERGFLGGSSGSMRRLAGRDVRPGPLEVRGRESGAPPRRDDPGLRSAPRLQFAVTL